MTHEDMREQCAQVADSLERRWRASAAKQLELYERAWIGGHGNLRNAGTIDAAADGVAAIAKVIRTLPCGDQ